ncbi:MAG TPA: NADH-quinone oxidoreductase subunit NuoF [Anaerolineae bacterium]|nr:NADH-quinone oxidoreductase subunit NuoF [Anaerolineae bacterium]HQH37720.1 NADH-quinone oxidoreductase subunit NuoF [Anaerolineae bacterium]
MIRATVLVSGDPLSLSRGAEETKLALEAELSFYGLEDEVQVGYTGQVTRTDILPAVIVYPEGTVYGPVTPQDGAFIVEEHLYKGRVAQKLVAPSEVSPESVVALPAVSDVLYGQQRIVLRRVGVIDPYSIEDYIAQDGYFALGRALEKMTPAEVLNTVKSSNLQGRGGAGFPTGLKWSFVATRPESVKYIVCNADESEPGTFKDRHILEGDPHAVLEGMALAGYAVGAHEGWIYIRGEYVMAKDILHRAIQQAEELNLLGDNILGSGFSFHIHLHAGAGAYICGEETALLESMEGKRGVPRIRPPYPTVYGYHGMPTVVNNVETLANVAPILLNGAEWYRGIGTKRSPGTKVYTMLGDVNVTGLIETPMGTTLHEVIEIYGGGMKNGKAFKCAQTGGSSGTIIPADLLDVPMDFASMAERGAGLGSGALLIADEDTDIVDLAYVLVRFFKTESCGKCTPCRVGTRQMLEALQRLKGGYAKKADLARLEEVANYVRSASFCGLGQAAPVPILTGLQYFREEFEAKVGS